MNFPIFSTKLLNEERRFNGTRKKVEIIDFLLSYKSISILKTPTMLACEEVNC
jgi:hypothetical protein